MATNAPAKSVSRNKKNTKRKERGTVATVLISFLIVILMTIAIVGFCMLGYVFSFVNGDIAINLDSYKNSQSQTSIIYAMDDNNKPYELARLHGEENRIWVDLDKIPKEVQNAFICLEDKRFYNHSGVDWIRTLKAVLTLGKSGGGSTITQQLIKNLTDENQATISRKFNEILYALNLEKNYDKSEIIEAYLNTIPLGSGCYGVQTAAQKYFGKDVSELNAAEAASIASITKAPTYYNPLLNPENNKKRQETCLWNMWDQGKLTDDEYKTALDYKLILTNSDEYVPSEEVKNSAPQKESKIYSYYVDFVIDSVIEDLVSTYGYTKNEAWKMVYYGGLKIYSCIDEKVQNAAEEVYVNRISFPYESEDRTETGANGTKKKVQSAITIMDYQGQVVAIVGGAGEKTTNRGLNRAADSPRSPGSSIKPLSAYAPAVEKGFINYSSMIQDYAIVVGGKRWPQNFSGSLGSPSSYVTTQYAVCHSLNTTAARVVQKLTPEVSMDYLINKFHLSTLVTEGAYTDCNLSSLAVGGMTYGVTTLEMSAAYATFGNGGKYYKPYSYTKVTDYQGKNVLLENNAVPEQAISAETATIMNRIMQTVVVSGTGAGSGVSGFPTYMKTGTTSDTKDKWAAGGTPYYCAAVWVGYDIQEHINAGSHNPAAIIWAAVMNRVHKGLPEKDFDYAKTVVARSYCTRTGLLAGTNCPSTATGYYASNKLPGTCTSCTGGAPATTESTTEAAAE
ncbi:MAG: transglycosylase domain-containing protein [Oscillospiraceae bacterium]|nr:transglycosylase domain-containing protein [Oscillospiraceae bacterium]